MLLEMATDEARELKWALDIRLVEMRSELVRSSDHAFRDELKMSLTRLETVAQRVEEMLDRVENAEIEGAQRIA